MKGLFAAVVLVFSLGAQAQEIDDRETVIALAMGVLDEFMLAFNARDIDRWANTLNYPHVRFASGTVSVYEDADEFTDRPVFKMLSETGWEYSHWISRDVVLVSAGKVHIATTFQRFNEDHEPIGTYESLYIVTLVDGHWGIQARSSLAP